MFKLLLILGITVYVLYKVGSFLFKIGAASQQFRDNQTAGNFGNNGAKSKKKPKITGEYIDYEEVK
ncbi:MAG TPA: hypothetical protein VFT90_18970 [Chryseosolibacter sp.]|nr:hypothetical protein [Chryseosolibacter sp.]